MKKINALGMSALVAVMLLNGCGPKQSATVAEKNDGQKETITTSNSKPQPEITKKEEVKQEEKKVEAKETVPAQKEVSTKKEEVSKVSTSTNSTKKNNSISTKAKSSKSSVQTKKSTSNSTSSKKATTAKTATSNSTSSKKTSSKGKTSSAKGSSTSATKPSNSTTKPKACKYKLGCDGSCNKRMCLTADQVYAKYSEWVDQSGNVSSFRMGDSDFDGCWVLYTNDGSFRVGED
ncbi:MULTISPECIES: hypothetical protein [Terrabacteria group]|uniref:hypothetical protein n=1 Tax=Bacillati TaxID=1783272 RepID=UPI001C6EED75|nr:MULTISPECIES: hypothetical protein [Terrabacteria group]MBW9213202.1 hypothetical protein [Trueperella sp. zg.1013]